MAELQTTIEEITDPEEITRFREGREQHRSNEEVFQRHRRRIYREFRGQVVVVAGQELYVAPTPDAAWHWARTYHPDDHAPIVRYIQMEKAWRIYATHGRMV